MTGLSRVGVVVVCVAVFLGLSACGGSSPSPSPSPSPPLADLTELAAYLGAQQAWWAALTPAEVSGLIGDSSWPGSDSGASATIYVVLARGSFNEASGNPMGWAVAVGQARADLASTAMESRPEVPGNTWTALDLPSPQADP